MSIMDTVIVKVSLAAVIPASALGVAAITIALTLTGGGHGQHPYHLPLLVAAPITVVGALIAMTITEGTSS
jgi:hypothetical protein